MSKEKLDFIRGNIIESPIYLFEKQVIMDLAFLSLNQRIFRRAFFIDRSNRLTIIRCLFFQILEAAPFLPMVGRQLVFIALSMRGLFECAFALKEI